MNVTIISCMTCTLLHHNSREYLFIYLFKIMLFDEIIKNQNISFELIMHICIIMNKVMFKTSIYLLIMVEKIKLM